MLSVVLDSWSCGLRSQKPMLIMEFVVLALEAMYIFYDIHRRYSQKQRVNRRSTPQIVDAEKARKEVAPSTLFPAYIGFIYVALGVLLLQSMIDLLKATTHDGALENYLSLTSSLVSLPVIAAVSEGLAFYLSQQNAGRGAVRRTVFFAVCWGVAFAMIGLGFWMAHHRKERTGVFETHGYAEYWLITDGMRASFYTIILVRQGLIASPRFSARFFCFFELLIFATSVVSQAIEMGVKESAGGCASFIVWRVWTILWPIIIYQAFKYDFAYWQAVADGADMALPDAKQKKSTMKRPLLPYVPSEDQPPVDFLIKYDDLTLEKEIGKGGTAIVYKGFFNGVEVAVKKFSPELLNPMYIRKFAQEMQIAARLRSEFLVECLGVCVVVPSLCMVFEYMHRGSLFQVLTRNKQLPAYVRLQMARDCARGLQFLHSRQPAVVHRDFKSLNLLVDRNWRVKITDFGEAREMLRHSDGEMTGQRGTPQWMAPECFLSQDYSEKVDIYSLGVVLWEIMTGKKPFANVSPWLVPAAVAERGERPPLEPKLLCTGVPLDIIPVIKRCWAGLPSERPTAEEAAHMLEDLLKQMRRPDDLEGKDFV